MKTRNAVKAIVITGWGAGAVLILAGYPLLLAFTAFVLTVGVAVLAAWRGAAAVAWVKVRAGRALERRVRTGRAVERA